MSPGWRLNTTAGHENGMRTWRSGGLALLLTCMSACTMIDASHSYAGQLSAREVRQLTSDITAFLLQAYPPAHTIIVLSKGARPSAMGKDNPFGDQLVRDLRDSGFGVTIYQNLDQSTDIHRLTYHIMPTKSSVLVHLHIDAGTEHDRQVTRLYGWNEDRKLVPTTPFTASE